jgi:hypothetical protein
LTIPGRASLRLLHAFYLAEKSIMHFLTTSSQN